MCLPSAQYALGGGLYVADGGVANIDGCNVFSNEAYVRPPYAHSQTFFQCPAEVALFLACAQNVAPRILNLLDMSSSAPLERHMLHPTLWQGTNYWGDPIGVSRWKILNPLGQSSSAPLERYKCSLSLHAVGRRALHLRYRHSQS